jgi:hypothetical protein
MIRQIQKKDSITDLRRDVPTPFPRALPSSNPAPAPNLELEVRLHGWLAQEQGQCQENQNPCFLVRQTGVTERLGPRASGVLAIPSIHSAGLFPRVAVRDGPPRATQQGSSEVVNIDFKKKDGKNIGR